MLGVLVGRMNAEFGRAIPAVDSGHRESCGDFSDRWVIVQGSFTRRCRIGHEMRKRIQHPIQDVSKKVEWRFACRDTNSPAEPFVDEDMKAVVGNIVKVTF